MTDRADDVLDRNADLLRTAFASHEHLAPDATAVYPGILEMARRYRRRRRGAQAAGALLGVGLIATTVSTQGLPFNRAATAADVSPAAGQAPETVAPTQPEDPRQPAFDAYFAAGYDADDALEIARIWNLQKEDLGDIKAELGLKLMHDQTLPIGPGEGPEVPIGTWPTDPDASPEQATLDATNAFFDGGYDYDDSVRLAEIWQLGTPYDAKVEAGQRLLAGETLPITP